LLRLVVAIVFVVSAAAMGATSGFREVIVFAGSASIGPNSTGPFAGSQARQDELVEHVFEGVPVPFYVDLAANDAVTMSNTWRLEFNPSWNGLCIEANPKHFWRLQGRRCTLVVAVVDGTLDKEVVFDFGGANQGIAGDGVKALRLRPQSTMLRTATLRAIFERVPVPSVIHYMSLDIEGAETGAMSAFPFELNTVLVMTIERPDPALIKLLYRHGYLFVWCLSWFGETVFVHNSLQSAYPAQASRLVAMLKKWRPQTEDICWINRLYDAAPPVERRLSGFPYNPPNPGWSPPMRFPVENWRPERSRPRRATTEQAARRGYLRSVTP
jgi:hypothetical protein